MPRKNKTYKEPLSKELLEYLEHGNTEGESIDLFVIRRDKSRLLTTWTEHKEKILTSWIRRFPGCRPFAFWLFDAKEPRQKISGAGKVNETYPHYCFGVNESWEWEENDIPYFESQASYLLRHKLLMENEREALEPEAFKLESIADIFGEGE